MKRNITPYLFILFTLYSITSYSQSEKNISHSKNAIHFSVGSALIANALHFSYDRLLGTTDTGFFKAYYASARVGVNGTIGFFGPSSTQIITSAGFTGLTGKGNKHFEFGLGVAVVFSKDNIDDEDLEFVNNNGFETFILPSVSIGYRKQAKNGLVFRTGVGITEWVYIGYGYSF